MKILGYALVLSSILSVGCAKTDSNAKPQDQASDSTQLSNNTSEVPVGDTAENALDWVGDYKGIFPCADCEGIETELELKADKTYEMTQEYLGKGKNNETKIRGKFEFDSKDSSIITLDQAGENQKFFVGENFVEAREFETGKEIKSNLNYKLIKE